MIDYNLLRHFFAAVPVLQIELNFLSSASRSHVVKQFMKDCLTLQIYAVELQWKVQHMEKMYTAQVFAIQSAMQKCRYADVLVNQFYIDSTVLRAAIRCFLYLRCMTLLNCCVLNELSTKAKQLKMFTYKIKLKSSLEVVI